MAAGGSRSAARSGRAERVGDRGSISPDDTRAGAKSR
jgi:hypothetical protein